MKKSDLRVLEVAASWAARLNWIETLRSASVAMRDATEEQAAAEYDRGLFILVKDMAEGLPMLRDALADTEEEGDWRAVGEYAEEFRRLAERLETLAAERFGRVIDGAAQEGDEFTAQTAAAVAGEVRLLLEMHERHAAPPEAVQMPDKAGAADDEAVQGAAAEKHSDTLEDFVTVKAAADNVAQLLLEHGEGKQMQFAMTAAAVKRGLLDGYPAYPAYAELFNRRWGDWRKRDKPYSERHYYALKNKGWEAVKHKPKTAAWEAVCRLAAEYGIQPRGRESYGKRE